MKEKDTKLVVVKLDDESSPLMKQYIHTEEKKPSIPLPKILQNKEPKKDSIQFDELSFATPSSNTQEAMNLSLLADSQEIKKKEPQVKQQVIPLPTPSRIEPHMSSNKDRTVKRIRFRQQQPIHKYIQPKPKPKFINHPEDGYQIGFMSSSKPRASSQTLPKHITSISKLEDILQIKAHVKGR